jgi:oligosaccharide repeat unit polymerase
MRKLNSGAGILKPTRIAFLVSSISITGALSFTSENFNNIRTPKMYDNYDLIMLGGLSTLFIFGLSVGSRRNSYIVKNDGISIQEVIRIEKLLFTLVILGYAIWAGLATTRGLGIQQVADVFSLRTNSVVETKAFLKGIAGITSLTQISPILSAILGYLRLKGEKWKVHFSVLAFLGTFRALLNAERLSIFEFLVPFLVISLFYSKRVQVRTIFFSIVSFPIIFSLFEFTRSWTNYYANTFQGSFLDFVTFRLFSYYVTAVNNGFLLIQEEGVGPRHPFYSFNFLYEFPIYGEDVEIGNEIYNPREGLITFFKYYSNPEFNNPGGLASLVLDYGWPISGLYISLVGLLIGVMWRKSISDPRYAFLYCALFLGILELPRYFFFGSSRFFPSLIVGVVILIRKPK